MPMNWPRFDDLDKRPEYVAYPDYHAINTIQLCELVNANFIDWTRPEWDWSSAAYSPEQFSRFCNAFISRFYWREIGFANPGEFRQRFMHKMIYELMPKYKNLYAETEDGINLLADWNEFGKKRKISSGYPETLLSENSNYVSSGEDEEFETVHNGSTIDKFEKLDRVKAVDTLILDELEVLFSGLFTTNVNGW